MENLYHKKDEFVFVGETILNGKTLDHSGGLTQLQWEDYIDWVRKEEGSQEPVFMMRLKGDPSITQTITVEIGSDEGLNGPAIKEKFNVINKKGEYHLLILGVQE